MSRTPLSRKAVRTGLVALLALGGLGVGAAPSSALSLRIGGVAIAADGARAVAHPGHETRFDDSFTVHQYGTVRAAGVRNRAIADSSGCSADDGCRAVALSFQIVTMAGTDIRLEALNLGQATNHSCPSCETVAGAYQFIVSTARPFTLSSADLAQLAAVHHALDALGRSDADAATLKARADALAARVTAVLQAAAARAPQPPTTHHPLTVMPDATAFVTVHRMFDR
ncbi:hypothetical protein [Streptacidiphilus monticola]|uniref:Uncharacterized protein n=1 Tax=Streptacidiphilus monticola TaxID=2161674 RepID=A0ABW1FYN9_9ACTN